MNEQIGNKINDKNYIKLTPFKGFVLENFPFIEADFDAITNYQLICKIVEYLNNVISNQNQVQELGTELVNAYNTLVDAVNLAINEFETNVTTDINQFKVDVNEDFDEFTSNITNQFNNLKNYVDNYFDNNFPELVSDKLDEMTEDGTLQNLLNNYANIQKTYNTYTELLADSSTFINGLRLKTLGFYSIGDGGDGEYYISNTNNGIVMDSLDSLYIILIPRDELNAKQFGAYGDDIHDDTAALNTCLLQGYLNGKNVFIPDGIYNISETLNIYGASNASERGFKVYGNNYGSSIIKCTDENLSDIIQLKSYGSNTTASRIFLYNLTINGDNKASNGIMINNTFTNGKIENITIRNCKNKGLGIANSALIYLSTLNKIRCDYCNIGIDLHNGPSVGNNTSLRIVDCYVQSCTNGYDISSAYGYICNCCADHITNYVFNFYYFSGVVLNCASESQAKIVFRFDSSNVTLINPWAFGNISDNTSSQISLVGSHVNVEGGNLLVTNNNVTTFPGKLINLGSQSSIELNNVKYNKYSEQDVSNVQRPITSNNNYGLVTQRDNGRIAYIGRDTFTTNGNLNNKNDNDTIKANAIYFGLGNEVRYLADGTDLRWAQKNVKGDILLSRNPAEIGGIGWVQSQDILETTGTNWVDGKYLKIPVIMSGSTTDRPSTNLTVGQMYLDTTIAKPIWWTGSRWIDSTGTTV